MAVITAAQGFADEVLSVQFAQAGLLCHPQGAPKQLVRPRRGDGGVAWRAKEKNPGTLNFNYGRRGWTDGKKAVSWTNYSGGNATACALFWRGRRIFIWPGVIGLSGNYYRRSGSDYNVPRILGASVAGSEVVAVLVSQSNVSDAALMALGPGDEAWPWLEIVAIHTLSGSLRSIHSEKVAPKYWREENHHGPGHPITGSVSPLGRTILAFLESEVVRVDVSSDSGSAQAVVSKVAHPRWSPLSMHIYGTLDTAPGNLHNDEENWDIACDGEWYVGANWAVEEGLGGESFTWARYLVSYVETYRSRWTYFPSGGVNDTPYDTHIQTMKASVLVQLAAKNSTVDLVKHIVDARGERPYWTTNTSVSTGETSATIVTGLDYQRALCCANYSHNVWDNSVTQVDRIYRELSVEFIDTEVRALNAGLIGASDQRVVGNNTEEIPNAVSVSGAIESVDSSAGNAVDRVYWMDPLFFFRRHCFFVLDADAYAWEGNLGSILDKDFLSVRFQDGSAINYMTDNPSLAGVFPEGVNTTARFDPIVPYAD